MKLTKWFLNDLNEAPHRPGVYEVSYGQPQTTIAYSYWSSSLWGMLSANVNAAAAGHSYPTQVTILRWRGLTESINSKPVQSYVAGDDVGWRYPGAGDPTPPGGAKVLLLTAGGVCVLGSWAGDGRYLAWSPMPRRNRAKELMC